ncbi:MAG: hypothetical protein KC620_21740, partial [Myxococcales bacterium]|nr:hypothetical protein [Myxococcales bacterium]
MRRFWSGVAPWLALAAVCALPGRARAVPDYFVQEGLVIDARGVPLAGVHSVRVRLYGAARGGAPLFDEVHPDVEFTDGYYAVPIGGRLRLDGNMFRGDVWLGVSIDAGPELSPRTALAKVPACFVADVATEVTGDIHPQSVSIGDVPVIDAQGRWVGDPTGLRGPAGP